MSENTILKTDAAVFVEQCVEAVMDKSLNVNGVVYIPSAAVLEVIEKAREKVK